MIERPPLSGTSACRDSTKRSAGIWLTIAITLKNAQGIVEPPLLESPWVDGLETTLPQFGSASIGFPVRSGRQS
jgi:hypothetical protein